MERIYRMKRSSVMLMKDNLHRNTLLILYNVTLESDSKEETLTVTIPKANQIYTDILDTFRNKIALNANYDLQLRVRKGKEPLCLTAYLLEGRHNKEHSDLITLYFTVIEEYPEIIDDIRGT